MSDGAVLYMQNVLGIRGWVKPVAATVSAIPDGGGMDVLVWTPFPMNANEKNMAVKMLSAVGFSSLVFLDTEKAPFSAEQIAQWSTQSLCSVSYGLPLLNDVAGPWLELPAIHLFLEGTPKGLVDLKRKTWEQLKEFKERVGQR